MLYVGNQARKWSHFTLSYYAHAACLLSLYFVSQFFFSLLLQLLLPNLPSLINLLKQFNFRGGDLAQLRVFADLRTFAISSLPGTLQGL